MHKVGAGPADLQGGEASYRGAGCSSRGAGRREGAGGGARQGPQGAVLQGAGGFRRGAEGGKGARCARSSTAGWAACPVWGPPTTLVRPTHVNLDPVCEQPRGCHARHRQQAGVVRLCATDAAGRAAGEEDGQRGEDGHAGHRPGGHVVGLQREAVPPVLQAGGDAGCRAGDPAWAIGPTLNLTSQAAQRVQDLCQAWPAGGRSAGGTCRGRIRIPHCAPPCQRWSRRKSCGGRAPSPRCSGQAVAGKKRPGWIAHRQPSWVLGWHSVGGPAPRGPAAPPGRLAGTCKAADTAQGLAVSPAISPPEGQQHAGAKQEGVLPRVLPRQLRPAGRWRCARLGILRGLPQRAKIVDAPRQRAACARMGGSLAAVGR